MKHVKITSNSRLTYVYLRCIMDIKNTPWRSVGCQERAIQSAPWIIREGALY